MAKGDSKKEPVKSFGKFLQGKPDELGFDPERLKDTSNNTTFSSMVAGGLS